MSFTMQCSSAQGISLGSQLEGFNYWITKRTFQSSGITYEAHLKDRVINRVQQHVFRSKNTQTAFNLDQSR